MNCEEMIGSDGYITVIEDWSEDFAKCRMGMMDLEVTDTRWAVVSYMRNYYDEYAIAPDQRHMLRKAGKELGYNSKGFYELFPNGPKQAAMIAGLAKPSGC